VAVLKRKKRAGSEIPTSATSDISFLLIVFFIVMPMKKDEIGLSMLLPGKKNEQTTVRVKQSHVLTVKVDEHNSVTVGGNLVTIDKIEGLVRERLLVEPTKTVVIVETHPDADYGMMIACLDEVRKSEARKVSLKTTGM